MGKYNCRFLFDVKGWAYYWRCMALKKYAPPDFDISMGSNYGAAFKEKKHHLVLQLAYSYAKDLRNHMDRRKYTFPLISSYNVGWGYANKWLTNVIKYSDWTIVNSYDMWDKSGRHPKTINISNGVDRDIFKIRRPIKGRKERILWVGSIAHKKTKNYDTILVPLQKELKRMKIPCDFKLVNSVGRHRLNQDQMSYWYNTGSIYVVASKTEGTPNPALEAASCGLTVVSTKVGNMPELIVDGQNGYLCDTNLQSISEGIKKALKKRVELAENMQETIKSWDWKERSKQYYNFLRKVIDG